MTPPSSQKVGDNISGCLVNPKHNYSLDGMTFTKKKCSKSGNKCVLNCNTVHVVTS